MTRREHRRRIVLYKAHEKMKELIFEQGLSFKEAIEQSIGDDIHSGTGLYAHSSKRKPIPVGFNVFPPQYAALDPGTSVQVNSALSGFMYYPGVTKAKRFPLSSHPYSVEFDIDRISRNIDLCIEDWTDMTDSWKQLYIKTFNAVKEKK